jgi:hypothetical protein
MDCIYPVTNQENAKQTIVRLFPIIYMVNYRAVPERFSRKALIDVVHMFMEEYPHGKGIAGDHNRHEFYAACKTIKQYISRNRFYRKFGDISPLIQSKFEDGIKAITHMGDGWEDITLDRFFRDSKYIVENGGKSCLTDKGIHLRNEAIRYYRKKNKEKLAARVVKSLPDKISLGKLGSITVACKDPSKQELINTIIVNALRDRAEDLY